MKNSFSRKIECPNELSSILDFFFLKHKDYLDNYLYYPFFDSNLVKSSLCHESLLKGQFSVWVYYVNNKIDSIFIGLIAKSEKINKKIYSEYLFLNNSKKGLCLINEAIEFAKKNNCERFYLFSSQRQKDYFKIKNILDKRNFLKDIETFYLPL